MAKGTALCRSVNPSFASDMKQQQPKDKAGVLSVNQVELHPWLSRPDIVDWCEKRGVILEAYAPLVRNRSKSSPAFVA